MDKPHHPPALYESLRKDWISKLEHGGELKRLSSEKRRMLATGSLDVFLAAELESLERCRRRSKAISGLTRALWIAACAALLALVLGELGVLPELRPSLSACALLLAASAAGEAWRRSIDRSVGRRSTLYAVLGRSTAALAKAVLA